VAALEAASVLGGRFRALADSPADADLFIGVLTGGVPLRSFMSPGYLIRLVGFRGFMGLARSR
jgi:hypothetical protein